MNTAMQKREITLTVPEDTARAFERASDLEKLRAERAVASALQTKDDAVNELEELMEQMSRSAKEHGLTEAKLNQLLDEK